MEVLWKPIPGYIEYEVSNTGDVRKRAHKIVYPEGDYQMVESSPVQSFRNSAGRQFVTLKGKQIGVHRLVALAFVPNPEEYTVVSHIDRNYDNNHADNLEWIPRKFYSANNPDSQSIRHGGSSGKRIKCLEDNNVFVSIKAAAKYYGFDYSRLVYAAGHKKTFKGKTFVYAPLDEVNVIIDVED